MVGERNKSLTAAKNHLGLARGALKVTIRLRGIWLRRIVYKAGMCPLTFE